MGSGVRYRAGAGNVPLFAIAFRIASTVVVARYSTISLDTWSPALGKMA